MALAPKIIISVRDNKGKIATTEIKIPTGLDLANMIEFAQAIVQLVGAITTGTIVGVSIGIGVDLTGLGLSTTPLSTSDVEEKGVFQFVTEGGFYTTVAIPCWADGNTVSGSDAIDQSDTEVMPFITAMTDGIELTDMSTVEPCDSREDDIVAIVWSREKFRASGKSA